MAAGLTFAVVVAHPDDDAYGFSGSVAKHAEDPGFRFVLIHATDGGGGDIRDGLRPTPPSSARHRPPGAPSAGYCMALSSSRPSTDGRNSERRWVWNTSIQL